MYIAHINIQPRENRHRLFHRVRNVMKLQIKEDLVSHPLDGTHDVRSFRIKKLHSDLDERLLVLELLKKHNDFCLTVKITCNNNVFSHVFLPCSSLANHQCNYTLHRGL